MSVVSGAISALQLVYTAYTSVKNNKQRCRQLVERCQLVVSRLELIVKQRGDKDLQAKMGDLESCVHVPFLSLPTPDTNFALE